VLTDSFADEKGNTVPASYYGLSPDFPLEALVTITFAEDGGKTKLTLRYLGIRLMISITLKRVGMNPLITC